MANEAFVTLNRNPKDGRSAPWLTGDKQFNETYQRAWSTWGTSARGAQGGSAGTAGSVAAGGSSEYMSLALRQERASAAGIRARAR
jgi:hypothetical protein